MALADLIGSGIRSSLVRICALFIGIPVGWAFAIAAIVLLFWNEGRTVKTQRALLEGWAKVVSVPVDTLDPANSGRLVHVQGRTFSQETLCDTLFGVSVNTLRLRRVVETYQWREEEREEIIETSAGQRKTVTTYRYDPIWSRERIDSSKFQKPAGHENPSSVPYLSAEWEAKDFHLGSFRLQPALRQQLKQFQPLGVRVGEPPPAAREAGFRRLEASFYRGANPRSPAIGDVRIVYESVEPAEVSVIALQEAATLGAYSNEGGGSLAMVRNGILSAAEMLRDADFWNRVLTWLYRIGGFVLMIAGFQLALRPLTVLGDVFPGLFAELAFALGFLGFLLALAITLMTISVAWITYRPQIGLPLLLSGLLLSIIIVWFGTRRRQHAA